MGVEFHPEQALTTAAETYANVASGGQDIGWALQGYSSGQFPVTDVLPTLRADLDEMLGPRGTIP